MKYAREVMDLMAAFPGREFKMDGLVRYAAGSRATTLKERRAIRKAIYRVLEALVDAGCVLTEPPNKVGGYTKYRWRPESETSAA